MSILSIGKWRPKLYFDMYKMQSSIGNAYFISLGKVLYVKYSEF